MAAEKSVFGKGKEGEEIALYTLSNTRGMKASVTNLGASLVNLMVPDSRGNIADVVLGFERGEDYLGNPSFFGAVIGPNANRIAGAAFEIDQKAYFLDANDGVNNLHSHKEKGYHKRIWNARTDENRVTFFLEDTDGNMGFPGNKKISVTYALDEENGLTLHYHGSSDKKTILNLTNHSYFNLDGHDSGQIEGHELWLNAAHYTPVVAGAIPTGEIAFVEGTPMDFTMAKTVGRDINADFEQLKLTGGYDHNWVVAGWNGELKHIATVKAPQSGRIMRVYTTLPGVQFYAGNFVDPQIGKGGASYGRRSGLCLETQFYPDSIHQLNFPSCVFGGENGREYDSVTVYRFE